MGPELGKETEQDEQQHGGQQRVAVQCASLGQFTHAGFADDRHLDHLVGAGGHDQQRRAQQEVVEHRRQAPAQADRRKITLGCEQRLGHAKRLQKTKPLFYGQKKAPALGRGFSRSRVRLSRRPELCQPACLSGPGLLRR
ncbi:hypothetical protein D3C75_734770 [compost metagenome]